MIGVLVAAGVVVQSTFGFLADHQTTVTVMAGIILTLLVPALIAWGVQAGIAAIANVIAWTTSAAGAAMSAGMQVVSLTLITVGWIRMGVQAMASAVRVAAAWLIAMGPIGLVIAAVIAIVFLIVKNWDTIKEKTAAAWSAIVGFITAFPGKAKAALSALGALIWGVISGAWERAKTGTTNGIATVVSFVRGLPGKIKSALGNLGSLLLNVGKDIMRRLRDGIEDGLGWVRDKLSGVGRLIPGWLKKILGISSPSRVMRDQVGQWIPAGIADGIDDGNPVLETAVKRMARTMVVPKTDMAMAGTNMFGAPGMGGSGNPLGGGSGGAIDYDRLAQAMASVTLRPQVVVGSRTAAKLVTVGTEGSAAMSTPYWLQIGGQ